MGHRCNLAVVDADGLEVYYAHWAALQLYRRLAYGPAHAVAFARAHRPGTWLDDLWAEGAALVDVPARRMVWFDAGREEIAVARAHRRLLAATWPGWSVEWARDGLGDVLVAAGLDRRAARPSGEPDAEGWGPAPAWEPELIVAGPDDDLGAGEQGSHQVITVTGSDGRTGAWLAEGRTEAVELGAGVLDRLPGTRYERLRQRVLPDCGLHVDVAAHRAAAWSLWPLPGSADTVPARWPGWDVEFWGDRVEDHVAAAGGAIAVPPVDEAGGVRRLAGMLHATPPDPVRSVEEIVAQLRAAGREVVLSGAVRDDAEVEPGPQDRERVRAALALLAR